MSCVNCLCCAPCLSFCSSKLQKNKSLTRQCCTELQEHAHNMAVLTKRGSYMYTCTLQGALSCHKSVYTTHMCTCTHIKIDGCWLLALCCLCSLWNQSTHWLFSYQSNALLSADTHTHTNTHINIHSPRTAVLKPPLSLL